MEGRGEGTPSAFSCQLPVPPGPEGSFPLAPLQEMLGERSLRSTLHLLCCQGSPELLWDAKQGLEHGPLKGPGTTLNQDKKNLTQA